jgi:hypothetical protein
MGEVSLFGVKIVEYDICVGGTGSSEDDDLSEGTEFTNELQTVRTNPHPGLNHNKTTLIVSPP